MSADVKDEEQEEEEPEAEDEEAKKDERQLLEQQWQMKKKKHLSPFRVGEVGFSKGDNETDDDNGEQDDERTRLNTLGEILTATTTSCDETSCLQRHLHKDTETKGISSPINRPTTTITTTKPSELSIISKPIVIARGQSVAMEPFNQSNPDTSTSSSSSMTPFLSQHGNKLPVTHTYSLQNHHRHLMNAAAAAPNQLHLPHQQHQQQQLQPFLASIAEDSSNDTTIGQRRNLAAQQQVVATGEDFTPSSSSNAQASTSSPHWLMLQRAQLVAREGVRQRMSQASDQLGYSLRQLYVSASSIAAGDLTGAGAAAGSSLAPAPPPPPSYHNIPGIVPYYHGRSSGPPPSYDDVVNPYAAPPTYQSLFGQMLEARKKSRGFLDLLRRLLIVSTLGCTIIIALMILIPFTMIIIGAIYMDQCKVEHIPAFLLVGGCVWASKNIIHCYVQCQPQPGDATLDSFSDLEAATSQAAAASSNSNSTPPNSNSNSVTFTTSNINNNNNSASTREQQQQHASSSLVVTSNSSEESLTQVPSGQDRALTQDSSINNNNSQSGCRQRLQSAICESLLNCILFGWFIAGCVIVLRNFEPDFEDTTSEKYCNRTVYMYTFWLISSGMLMFGLFVGCVCCLMISSAIASRQEDFT